MKGPSGFCLVIDDIVSSVPKPTSNAAERCGAKTKQERGPKRKEAHATFEIFGCGVVVC